MSQEPTTYVDTPWSKRPTTTAMVPHSWRRCIQQSTSMLADCGMRQSRERGTLAAVERRRLPWSMGHGLASFSQLLPNKTHFFFQMKHCQWWCTINNIAVPVGDQTTVNQSTASQHHGTPDTTLILWVGNKKQLCSARRTNYYLIVNLLLNRGWQTIQIGLSSISSSQFMIKKKNAFRATYFWQFHEKTSGNKEICQGLHHWVLISRTLK
jgi:hypothetical protein